MLTPRRRCPQRPIPPSDDNPFIACAPHLQESPRAQGVSPATSDSNLLGPSLDAKGRRENNVIYASSALPLPQQKMRNLVTLWTRRLAGRHEQRPLLPQ